MNTELPMRIEPSCRSSVVVHSFCAVMSTSIPPRVLRANVNSESSGSMPPQPMCRSMSSLNVTESVADALICATSSLPGVETFADASVSLCEALVLRSEPSMSVLARGWAAVPSSTSTGPGC